MKTVSNRKLAQFLMWIYRTKYNGFWHTKFHRRSDGTVRSIQCKLSDKYSKGGQLLYDLIQKRLICVMDVDLIPKFKAECVQCRGCRAIFPKGTEKCAMDGKRLTQLSVYRNINLDDLISVSFEGQKFVTEENKEYA